MAVLTLECNLDSSTHLHFVPVWDLQAFLSQLLILLMSLKTLLIEEISITTVAFQFRSLIIMYNHMAGQMSFTRELLEADATFVLFGRTLVELQMTYEGDLLAEPQITHGTREGLLSCMYHHVPLQRSLLGKRFETLITFERSLSCMS